MSLFDSVPQRPSAVGSNKKEKKQKSITELLYDHPTSQQDYVPPAVHPTSLDTFTAAKPEPVSAPKPKTPPSPSLKLEKSTAELLYDHPTSQNDYVPPVVHPTSLDTSPSPSPTPQPPAQSSKFSRYGAGLTSEEVSAFNRFERIDPGIGLPSGPGFGAAPQGTVHLNDLVYRPGESQEVLRKVDSSVEGRAYTTNPEWEDNGGPYWTPYDHPKDQAQAIESQRGLGEDATAGSNGQVGPGYPQKEGAPKPAYTLPENATTEDIANAQTNVGERIQALEARIVARTPAGAPLEPTPEEQQELRTLYVGYNQLEAKRTIPSPGALAASDARARDSINRIEAMDQGLPDPAPNGAARMAMPGEGGRTTMSAPTTRRELVKDLAESWSEAELGEMYGGESQAKKDILALQGSNPDLFEEINERRRSVAIVGEPGGVPESVELDLQAQRLEHQITQAMGRPISPQEAQDLIIQNAANRAQPRLISDPRQDEVGRLATELARVRERQRLLAQGGYDRGKAAQDAAGQTTDKYGSAPKGGAGPATSPRQRSNQMNAGGAGFNPTDPIAERLERERLEAQQRAKAHGGLDRTRMPSIGGGQR